MNSYLTEPLKKISANEELWIDHPDAIDQIIHADISSWLKEYAVQFIQDGYVVIKYVERIHI